MTQSDHLDLTPEEVAALNDLATGDSPPKARRARIILLTAENVPLTDIANAVELSERQVRRWQRMFLVERMGIFSGKQSRPQPAREDTGTPEIPDLSAGAPPVPPPVQAAPPPQAKTPEPELIPGGDAPRRELVLTKKVGLTPEDPMSEAGRKTLLYHFERMLLHEPGSRLGEDIEAVHDMRVATRRMRSAFRIFRSYYKPKAVAPFLRGLRQTARRLGAVRDMDVFLEKLAHYQEASPGDHEGSLAPLIEACEAQRDIDREKLIAHLNSPNFARFVDTFAEFLTTPTAGAKKIDLTSPAAYQVRHVAPRMIYTRYEAARAYETVLDRASVSTLHTLRIECKQLRYAMEFFTEVLGAEIKNVINEVKKLQDHLGDLNDAEVANAFLQEFINQFEASQTGALISERRSIEHVIQYMAFQVAEKHRLTTTFPEVWAQFNRYEIRRDLALAVAAL